MSVSVFLYALLTTGAFVLGSVRLQAQTNLPLKRQLDSIYLTDQTYREYLSTVENAPRLQDSLSRVFNISQDNLVAFLWARQNQIDSSNLVQVEAIFKQHGYPGKTLVGTPTNQAAWYVIQHSAAIKTYFRLIATAGKQNELPFPLVATMQDRLLSQLDKPQIYGSQVVCYPPRKQPDHTECFVWPISQPRNVNKRRRRAGFADTVEDYAKGLGVAYRVFSKAQIKKLYQTP